MYWEIIYVFICYIRKKMEGFGSWRIRRGCVTFDTPSQKKKKTDIYISPLPFYHPFETMPCSVVAGNLCSNWRIPFHN